MDVKALVGKIALENVPMDVILNVVLVARMIVVQVVQKAALVTVQAHVEQTALQTAGTGALQDVPVDAAAPARTQQNKNGGK